MQSISQSHSRVSPSPLFGQQITGEFQVRTNDAENYGGLCERFLAGHQLPCFLGLSPSTSHSNYGHLRAILSWLAPKTPEVIVLEGSYFSRWDLVIFGGLTEEEATNKVLGNVNRFNKRLRKVAAELGVQKKVSPLPWPEVLTRPETIALQQTLREYAKANERFASDIDSMLDEFLSRAHPQEAKSLSTQQREILKNYIFEELSVFIHLCQIGYPLEVYPGSDLEIMQRIASGYYEDFSVRCPDRSHLAISVIAP